jgi:hypothetical protein
VVLVGVVLDDGLLLGIVDVDGDLERAGRVVDGRT